MEKVGVMASSFSSPKPFPCRARLLTVSFIGGWRISGYLLPLNSFPGVSSFRSFQWPFLCLFYLLSPLNSSGPWVGMEKGTFRSRWLMARLRWPSSSSMGWLWLWILGPRPGITLVSVCSSAGRIWGAGPSSQQEPSIYTKVGPDIVLGHTGRAVGSFLLSPNAIFFQAH